jgi:anti-sigma B factor antagonist
MLLLWEKIPLNQEMASLANTFVVSRTLHDGIPVLALDGFLDAHTAPNFEAAIQQEVDGGNLRIIANCDKLTYISSAGLGVFMSFIEEIRERGGDIKICSVQPKVMQVFEILGFPALFDIVTGVGDAIGKFQESNQER